MCIPSLAAGRSRSSRWASFRSRRHGAQNRVRERHDFDDPEGRLIGFYSRAVLLTSVHRTRADVGTRAGLEIT